MPHRTLAILFALLFSIASSRAQGTKPASLLFVGNSITLHGPSAAVNWTGNWGMAASAAEKDYVHLVVEALGKRPGGPPAYRVVNAAEFERNFETYDIATRLKDELAAQPSTVIVALGENVPSLKTEDAKAKFRESMGRFFTLLKGQGSALYVRSCFWSDPVKDALLKEACTVAGGIFVDISALAKDQANYARSEREIAHAGVGRHPGNQGMKAIADALVAAMEKAK